jgi:hypothetical protein
MQRCLLILTTFINLPNRHAYDRRQDQSASQNKMPTLLLNESQGSLGEKHEAVRLTELLTGQVLSASRHSF